LILQGAKVDFGVKMGNKIYYAQSKKALHSRTRNQSGTAHDKKEKKRQKDAEQII